MQFQPYLTFDGSCAEAMKFYERVIGGNVNMMMRFGDAPKPCGEMPPGSEDRIMHACLNFQDSLLMASDSMPGQPYEGIKNVGIALTYPTPDEAKPVFNALSEGGQVTMPMSETFWAESFGMVTDRFGTTWLISGGPKAM